MSYYLNYEGGKINFSLPATWNVLSSRDCASAPVIEDVGKEILNVLKEAAESGNKLVVILDDSYFGLVFEDNIVTESLFSRLSNLHENLLAVKVDGITKEEYAWGFRVGFITYGIKNGDERLYQALEDKTAGAVRGNISNSSHPSQSLFLNALESETYDKEKERNKDKIRNGI